MADRSTQTSQSQRYTLRTLMMSVGLLFLGIRFGVPLMDPSSHCHRSGESNAGRILYSIGRAQTRFYKEDPDGDGIQNYARSLSELGGVGLIDPYLAGGTRGSYAYEMSSDGKTWSCHATPQVPGWRCSRTWPSSNCGRSYDYRNLVICPDATVRASRAGPAHCQSPEFMSGFVF
ncbi:MAG: hypothetical protein O7H41_01370 [Planctomycetota bacterium]|nr:hypothetical protein [Planctomycetota bacterium]